MTLPLLPPLEPMLARLERELPVGDEWVYEPKWDGFRCLAFSDGDDVMERPFAERPEHLDSLLCNGSRALLLTPQTPTPPGRRSGSTRSRKRPRRGGRQAR